MGRTGVFLLLLGVVALCPAWARATTVPPLFVDVSYAPGVVFIEPTAMAFMPDGRLLVAEKAGRVWAVKDGACSLYPLWRGESEVMSYADRGLLGLAVDPNYVVNHYLYLMYAVDADSNDVEDTPPDNFGRLIRVQVSFTDSTTVDPESRTVLMGVSWRYGPLDAYYSHSIGSLRWGSDGSLLVSAGDGASDSTFDDGGLDPGDFGPGPDKTDPYEDIGSFRSQSLTSLDGKILRIDPHTGAGYRSNPYFDGNPYSRRSRVYQYGLRNPFRFCVRPGTGAADTTAGNPGTLYMGDVGMVTWEEIDVARTPGLDFGWPCYEGFPVHPGYQSATPAHNGCNSFGTPDNPATVATAPLITWNHSNPNAGTPPGFTGFCVVGGTFYTGSTFPAQYQGAYFFADFGGDWIRTATVDAADHLQSVADFATAAGNPTDFVVDPVTGDLLYTAFGAGEVRRIQFTGPGGNAQPIAMCSASVTYGRVPLTVDFSSAGSFDPEGEPITTSWTLGTGAHSTQANPSYVYAAAGVYPVVLTVTDGHGGVAYDTVTVVAAATTSFPSTPVVDNFNRGSLGSSWVDQPAGLSLNSNALVSNGSMALTEWSGASFGANQEAYVTLVTPSATASEQDLLLKVQGATWTSGAISVRYSAPSTRVSVYTYTSVQGWVQRGIITSVTYSAGQRFGARALADGTVQVFRDTTLLGSVSVAAWPFAALGGRIGLAFTGANGGRYDNFGGGNADLGVSAAPVVTLESPVGGEAWQATTEHLVTWQATDDVGVTGIDVYYRESATTPWKPLSLMQANNGSFAWSVHDTPTQTARIKVVAHDASGNAVADSSHADFTIQPGPPGRLATTLRDFFEPGTQPLEAGSLVTHDACYSCHGGYNAAVEPGKNFRGTMMAQAARDPLFLASLAIAEQDAPASGDLCLRCHAPMDWLTGRSQPTNGAKLGPLGHDGVSCDFCHRLVDPIYQAGVSPVEDQAVLAAMLPSHVPTGRSNGQYVVDTDPRRRGPFTDPLTPHTFLTSSFHRSSDLCATCHDVSNPVLSRPSGNLGAKYVAGPLDAPAPTIDSSVLMPLERTYSEWKNSDYPAGVYAPQFAGNLPSGTVSSCQDCHLRDVTGAGCNYGAPPTRTDLPLHDMTGGNAWIGGVVASLYPSETDSTALKAGAVRAQSMLQKAAVLDLTVAAEGDSARATAVVTNRTGHKLPTGFPEGRRMWLNVVGRDQGNVVVYQSCPYDVATGVLTPGPAARVYEVKQGLSPSFAQTMGLSAGPSFHFVLNDTLYQDNRIPPQGFTSAAFATFGGVPVDPGGAGYVDGQNWDVTSYPLPPTVHYVTATLYYQTTTQDLVEHLRNDNTTNGAGETLYQAWIGNGRAAPVVMARDSVPWHVLATPAEALPRVVSLRVLGNPFRGRLDLLVALPQAADVQFEVLDVTGRVVRRVPSVHLVAGEHRLAWDGRTSQGRAVTPGAYWLRARIGDRAFVRHVIALR